jgi:hypothetical protein
LADSLPREKLDRLEEELKISPSPCVEPSAGSADVLIGSEAMRGADEDVGAPEA